MGLERLPQFWRYAINGVIATCVHYSVLTIAMDGLHVGSAGTANLFAAAIGIATSFVGSRMFVFPDQSEAWTTQFMKFLLLYAVIALLHAAILYVWTDRMGRDYRIGFLIATGMQFISSYFGNKMLVFQNENR